MNPRVSVIVPIFGVEKYIERCVRSLFEQTFKEVEYIFVDDCSQDHSMQVLERVMADYPEVKTRIIRKARNEGLPQARRSGLELATGDYVMHIDSDDWVEPDMIDTLYQKAVETDSDMVCCDWVEEYAEGQVAKSQMPYDRDQYFQRILSLESDAYVWCRMVKRSIYADLVFPINNMFEDYVITSQLVKRCQRIVFVPRVLYHYLRSNDNSICSSEDKRRKLIQEIENIYIIYNQEKGDCSKGKKSRVLGRMLFAMGWHCMRRNLWPLLSQEMCETICEGVRMQIPAKGLGFSWTKQTMLSLFARYRMRRR